MGVGVWEIFERGLTYKMRGEIIITRHDTTRHDTTRHDTTRHEYNLIYFLKLNIDTG